MNSLPHAPRSGRRGLAALLLAALSATLHAQSLSGRVVDPNGVPIAGIEVDPGSGGSPTAISDALGNFVITGLAVDDYDVEYLPAIGAPWAARIINTVVAGATNVGDVVLQPGFDLTGHVQDQNGLSLMSCNLNVYAPDGTKLFTPHDNTDALGNFRITVPAGTWDIRVQPPVGAAMISVNLFDVVVNGGQNLGTVTLPVGHVVTGTVVDAVSGVPVSNTRLRATRSLSGEEIHLPMATTNVFGQFTVLLPFGYADLEFTPPLGNLRVARQMFGVPITGATAMGPVQLQPGVALSGTVTAGGAPVVGADIDVLDAYGVKIVTPYDKTAANGSFSVVVPTGNGMRLRVEPNNSVGLVGQLGAPMTITGATNVGTVALQSGVAVSGVVQGQGLGEFDAALHFVDGSGNELVTVADHTDATGHYTTWVPAGTWQVSVTTAEGSLRQASAPQPVTITGATTLDFVLADKLARTAVSSFGVPTMPQGTFLPINVLLHSMAPGLQTILIDITVDRPTSGPFPLLTGLPLTLPPIPFEVSWVFVPLPPVAPGDVGRPLEMRVSLRDASGTVLLDEGKTTFYVN